MKFLIAALFISFYGQLSHACSIEIQQGDLSGIPLKSPSPRLHRLANIIENCPESSGYEVVITSQNGSKLKSKDSSYPYRISYNQELPVDIETPHKTTHTGPSGGVRRSLDILAIGNANPVAGTYADTITISINAR